MTIETLVDLELAEVTGAGWLTPLGNAIIGVVNLGNAFVSNPVVDVVGQVVTAVGLGTVVHLPADLSGYIPSVVLTAVARSLGATAQPKFHFDPSNPDYETKIFGHKLFG